MKYDTKHSKNPHTNNKYGKSGIYQMKCLDCPLKHIGQTGRAFHTRYKEHMQAIRSHNGNSGYSNHILNTGYTYGNISDTMDVIKTERKGKNMNTLERYHTHKISKNKLHMNYSYIDTTTRYSKYYRK
jgi:hypothetical protein